MKKLKQWSICFFSCSYSTHVLNLVCAQFGMVKFPTRCSAWHHWVLHFKHLSAVRIKSWFAAISGVIYMLWKERNSRLFKGKTRAVEAIAAGVNYQIRRRINGLHIKGKTAKDRLYLTTIGL